MNIYDKAICVTYICQVLNNTLYWEWLRNNAISGVYPGAWYNGFQENNSSYIGDKCSILVGMPRIRQLRVKPGKITLLALTVINIKFPLAISLLIQATPDVMRIKDMITQGEFSLIF